MSIDQKCCLCDDPGICAMYGAGLEFQEKRKLSLNPSAFAWLCSYHAKYLDNFTDDIAEWLRQHPEGATFPR